ncbi:MAG: hypothetical protein J5527_04895 [Treponema sp.]|nr:hypothetical protein [Treponema sp.]
MSDKENQEAIKHQLQGENKAKQKQITSSLNNFIKWLNTIRLLEWIYKKFQDPDEVIEKIEQILEWLKDIFDL